MCEKQVKTNRTGGGLETARPSLANKLELSLNPPGNVIFLQVPLILHRVLCQSLSYQPGM